MLFLWVLYKGAESQSWAFTVRCCSCLRPQGSKQSCLPFFVDFTFQTFNQNAVCTTSYTQISVRRFKTALLLLATKCVISLKKKSPISLSGSIYHKQCWTISINRQKYNHLHSLFILQSQTDTSFLGWITPVTPFKVSGDLLIRIQFALGHNVTRNMLYPTPIKMEL